MENIEKANKKTKTKIIKLAQKEVKKITKQIKAEIYNCRDYKKRAAIISNSYKRYTKIYLLYGQCAYLKCVPSGIRLKDADELYKQGKFITIYEKHGKKAYKYIQNSVLAKDIEQETGSKIKGKIAKATKEVIDMVKKAIPMVTLAIAAMGVGANLLLINESQSKNEKSIEENAQEISKYIESIQEYSKEVKALKLADIENIMKVIDDMWSSIKGYGQPQKDIPGCLGLDMYKENGIGLCRNMADDCAKKLNEINPEYNARVIAVDLDTKQGEVQIANIKQIKIINIEEIEKEDSTDDNYMEKESELLRTISKFADTQSGNHAVISMDIPEDNITLIVDPTNPSIGVYKNGEIKMFNSLTSDGMILKRRIVGDEILNGTDSFSFPKEYFQSFLPCNLSQEELEEKYGIKAQNEALDKVRELEIKKLKTKEFVNYIKDYYNGQGINIRDEIDKIIIPKQSKNSIEKDNER